MLFSTIDMFYKYKQFFWISNQVLLFFQTRLIFIWWLISIIQHTYGFLYYFITTSASGFFSRCRIAPQRPVIYLWKHSLFFLPLLPLSVLLPLHCHIFISLYTPESSSAYHLFTPGAQANRQIYVLHKRGTINKQENFSKGNINK